MASISIALRPWPSLPERPGTQEAGMSRRQAFALVLLAACLWGTIGTAYHLLRGVADRRRLDRRRPACQCRRRAPLGLAGAHGSRCAACGRADLPRLIGFGVGSLGLMYLALFTAFDLSSVAVGTVLLYLARPWSPSEPRSSSMNR